MSVSVLHLLQGLQGLDLNERVTRAIDEVLPGLALDLYQANGGLPPTEDQRAKAISMFALLDKDRESFARTFAASPEHVLLGVLCAVVVLGYAPGGFARFHRKVFVDRGVVTIIKTGGP